MFNESFEIRNCSLSNIGPIDEDILELIFEIHKLNDDRSRFSKHWTRVSHFSSALKSISHISYVTYGRDQRTFQSVAFGHIYF